VATQAERRTSTRQRILDAALACLVETGTSGFTTTAVVSQAGVSRGALFDHFPTKADLEAATIEALFDEMVADYEERFHTRLSSRRTVAAAVAQLVGVFSDERLLAVYGWFTAARTDPQLRAALTPVVTAHVARLRSLGADLLVGPSAPDDVRALAAEMVELVVMALQGQAVNQLAAPDPGMSRRIERQVLLLAEGLLPAD
jgi:AcrR family transcriptional regulator